MEGEDCFSRTDASVLPLLGSAPHGLGTHRRHTSASPSLATERNGGGRLKGPGGCPPREQQVHRDPQPSLGILEGAPFPMGGEREA